MFKLALNVTTLPTKFETYVPTGMPAPVTSCPITTSDVVLDDTELSVRVLLLAAPAVLVLVKVAVPPEFAAVL